MVDCSWMVGVLRQEGVYLAMRFRELPPAYIRPNVLYEEGKYTPPRTVGCARVAEIRNFGNEATFEIVLLDIRRESETDQSQAINRVPVGLFHKYDIAEVIVRQFQGYFFEPMSLVYRRNGGFYIVAIRPFSRITYGKAVDSYAEPYKTMFDINVKGREFAPAFYIKFGL